MDDWADIFPDEFPRESTADDLGAGSQGSEDIQVPGGNQNVFDGLSGFHNIDEYPDPDGPTLL